MLRALLAALVAANLLFFGYTRGTFDGVLGLDSTGGREPERVAAQVRPDSIVLMRAGPAASGATPFGATASCLEAGPIAAADVALAESALRTLLPAGGWTDVRHESVGGAPPAHTYRIGNVDAATAYRLTSLRLDASGRSFNPCAGGTSASSASTR